MSNRKWITAAAAAWIVALAAMLGCGEDEDESAAAPRQAQHEHGHDHGAPTPAPGAGDGHQHHGAAQEKHPASHGGSPADHSAMGHGSGQHAAGHAPEHGASQHAGHGSPARRPAAGGHDHGSHSRPAAPREEHAGHAQPAAPGQDHAGHSAAGAGTPARPVAELPTQPAGILQPDPVDAPAATSVADAQRAAEMNQAMSGEHAGHGAGDYRHVDAGRGQEDQRLYACPVHPEVTSQTQGTCPKCGRKLVERREE